MLVEVLAFRAQSFGFQVWGRKLCDNCSQDHPVISTRDHLSSPDDSHTALPVTCSFPIANMSWVV